MTREKRSSAGRTCWFTVALRFDSESVALLGGQQMGRWKMAEVFYSPFAYNPVRGVVQVAENITLVINYDLGDPLPEDLAGTAVWDDEAAEMFANYAEVAPQYDALVAAKNGIDPATSDVGDYVIITTSAIQSGSAQLANSATSRASDTGCRSVTPRAPGAGAPAIREPRTSGGGCSRTTSPSGLTMCFSSATPIHPPATCRVKMTWPRSGAGSDEESPTDYYYADLTSNWNTDGDGYYGEWSSRYSVY